jgi:hypothetical protein
MVEIYLLPWYESFEWELVPYSHGDTVCRNQTTTQIFKEKNKAARPIMQLQTYNYN